MNLQQIKEAVLSDTIVYWGNKNYIVVKDNLNQWFIKSTSNGHCIGLTWADDITLNGKESDFFTI